MKNFPYILSNSAVYYCMPNKFHYVWNEWFKSLDEIAADPRCEVEESVFLERLKDWPIEQAVKKTPDWHPNDIVAYNLTRRLRNQCTEEQLRYKLRQGYPPELAVWKSPMHCKLFCYALGITFAQYLEAYKQVAPEIPNWQHIKEAFKQLKTPVTYIAFATRIRAKWEVKAAALCDFRFLIFGKKYKNRKALIAEMPWVATHFQGRAKGRKTLEERVAL